MTARAPLEVLVNGEARRMAVGSTLADLVEELGFGGRRIAVAVNREGVITLALPLSSLRMK